MCTWRNGEDNFNKMLDRLQNYCRVIGGLGCLLPCYRKRKSPTSGCALEVIGGDSTQVVRFNSTQAKREAVRSVPSPFETCAVGLVGLLVL